MLQSLNHDTWSKQIGINLKSARLPTTGYARAIKIMFIWRELGGTGTGCLFQFTYCDNHCLVCFSNTDNSISKCELPNLAQFMLCFNFL